MKLPFDDFHDSDLFSDQKFETMLHRFLEKEREPFSLKQVLRALGKRDTQENVSQLGDYLLFNSIAYCQKFSETEEIWLSRAGLFTGREFAVVPSKTELAAGIFIPGSRCVPFANPKLLPQHFQFFSDGKKMNQTLVDTTEEEIYPYYILFGEEFIPQYLAMDNAESQEIFQKSDFLPEESGEFPVTVVDMSGFYWKHGVHPGDALVFKVENWNSAVFSVSVRHKENADAAELKKWRSVFEDALLMSFQAIGPAASIEEQITTAFFIGEREIFSVPPDDISIAIASSETIELAPYGAETRLWEKNARFPTPANWAKWFEGATGVSAEDTDGSIGKIPVCEEVFNAYIMDALYKREDSPRKVFERLNALCAVPYKETEMQEEIEIVHGEFYFLRESYNWFADRTAGPARERLVNLYSEIIVFVNSIQQAGVSPKNIEDQDVIMLGQLAAHIITCLESFYHDQNNAATLFPEESLAGMEETFGELKISMQNAIGELRRKK